MRRWQETAALRDCDRAYVRIGSIASDRYAPAAAACPLRAKSGQIGRCLANSALCQSRPNAPQQKSAAIRSPRRCGRGARHESRSRSPLPFVYHQLKLGGLFDRQVGRIGPAQGLHRLPRKEPESTRGANTICWTFWRTSMISRRQLLRASLTVFGCATWRARN